MSKYNLSLIYQENFVLRVELFTHYKYEYTSLEYFRKSQ